MGKEITLAGLARILGEVSGLILIQTRATSRTGDGKEYARFLGNPKVFRIPVERMGTR